LPIADFTQTHLLAQNATLIIICREMLVWLWQILPKSQIALTIRTQPLATNASHFTLLLVMLVISSLQLGVRLTPLREFVPLAQIPHLKCEFDPAMAP
jgi:hypothetical protein